MIAKGIPGWLYLVPFFSVISLVLSVFASKLMTFLFIIGICLFILSFPLFLFFRDPARRPAPGVVSPADGKVMFVKKNEVLGEWHIAIFMSPLNVHVNRAPLAGRVVKIDHIKGAFKPAFNKESEHNERVVTVLATGIGKVKIIQIAGAVARRIVPYISEGQEIVKGQKIGMIRFGSRVDLFLPLDRFEPGIVPGQKVKAGISTIGNLADRSISIHSSFGPAYKKKNRKRF